MPDSTSPDPRRDRRLRVSIALGLLTFVVTPLVAVVVALPFLFLGKVPDRLNPIVLIARLFGLHDLGGFFAAEFLLIAFLALMGDCCTAGISWLLTRSKKAAITTAVSALAFQCIAVAVRLPAVLTRSHAVMKQGIEVERSYQQFAKIGDVSFRVQELPSDVGLGNDHPEYGHKYQKLLIAAPISIRRSGSYLVTAEYSFAIAGRREGTPKKHTTEVFAVGDHTVGMEFLANEVGSYGYWSPSSVGGSAEIQIYYLASEKEVLDRLKTDSSTDKRMLEMLEKEEGLDRRTPRSNPTINKFVGRKTVRF